MVESKKGLRGLKPYAEATLLQDLRVTPALKERLDHRIRVLEKQQQSRRELKLSPWVWRSTAAALAVCLFIAMGMKQRGILVAPPAEHVEADRPVGGAQSTRGAAAGPAPDSGPVTPQYMMTPPGGTPSAFTVTVGDARGAAVTYGTSNSVTVTSAVKDSLSTATAPTIPGVETQPGRKMIFNADYSLQVKDAAYAFQQLQSVATATGGYVVDANLNKGDDGAWTGRLTLRIPAAKYQGAVDQVRQFGDIKQERQWAQDVTDQYMDLESRIRIQQDFEKKLTELAGKAEKFEDWLKLTQQINETRAGVERMQGQIKLLGNQVEYSTINVWVNQPVPGKAPAPKPEPAKGVWTQMTWAFGDSIRVLMGLGKDLLVGFAATTPFLVLVALAGVALLVAVRARIRKRVGKSTDQP